MNHGNVTAEEGCTICTCGCKYWENDKCIDCGATPELVFIRNYGASARLANELAIGWKLDIARLRYGMVEVVEIHSTQPDAYLRGRSKVRTARDEGARPVFPGDGTCFFVKDVA